MEAQRPEPTSKLANNRNEKERESIQGILEM
jgi:hypothetical protein